VTAADEPHDEEIERHASWAELFFDLVAVAGVSDQTRVVRLLIGMFGLGVMAASVPGVAHTVLGDGDSVRPLNVFAIAYIATRIYGSEAWHRGEVLLDFPVARYTVGLLPCSSRRASPHKQLPGVDPGPAFAPTGRDRSFTGCRSIRTSSLSGSGFS
jgi:hypothetical protein